MIMNPPSSLRVLLPQDVPLIFEIERRAYPFPWTEQILLDCVRVGYSGWVTEHNETIVGYCIMSIAAGEAHVLNLCVDPSHQGKGLGRQMLAHAIEDARQHQVETLFLEVRTSNAPAIHLYHDMGFNEIGRRRNYYPSHNGREDALMFALTLLPPFA